MVSPWNVGILCLSSSTSRLAMATPLTSGTLIPSTSEYTRLPTTTFLPNCVCVSANQASVWSGWWFIVIMQKRWSSYSVMVFPGQCLYTSPGSKSSKYRPKGRSCTVIRWSLRSPLRFLEGGSNAEGRVARQVQGEGGKGRRAHRRVPAPPRAGRERVRHAAVRHEQSEGRSRRVLVLGALHRRRGVRRPQRQRRDGQGGADPRPPHR